MFKLKSHMMLSRQNTFHLFLTYFTYIITNFCYLGRVFTTFTKRIYFPPFDGNFYYHFFLTAEKNEAVFLPCTNAIWIWMDHTYPTDKQHFKRFKVGYKGNNTTGEH